MITARASRNAAMGVAKRSIFSAGDKDKLASAASFKQFTEVMMKEIAARKHMLPPDEQAKFDKARVMYEKHVDGMSAKDDEAMMTTITAALSDKDSVQAKLVKQLMEKIVPPKEKK